MHLRWGQLCFALSSKKLFHAACSQLSLANGSFASHKSSLATSGIWICPEMIVLSSLPSHSSISSFILSASSNTQRSLPRDITYVTSPLTLSTVATRTLHVATGVRPSESAGRAGSEPPSEGSVYASSGSIVSRSSSDDHFPIAFSSHVAALFHAAPAEAAACASSAAASSALSGLCWTGALCDLLRAQ
eukprot:CAMPEP_0181242224 /NCGR_PEP_ID=MMETSP1096-20121128/41564_1 /TAXON_ID=156174 ORGANISM="Chrysochromulina ericina, Strain CCMP281" /NCGR_SAMPLE_ID=MMETSP1096 /ASSEMBLY_ACC=CAM_ASM_000453 /LENGTH=188 /DNA_ID=CAMNT_0023338395 /DNA_START=475 /DNA_END=1041 /DNA_ORIENTATION=+